LDALVCLIARSRRKKKLQFGYDSRNSWVSQRRQPRMLYIPKDYSSELGLQESIESVTVYNTNDVQSVRSELVTASPPPEPE
jgi:hypothetical protein